VDEQKREFVLKDFSFFILYKVVKFIFSNLPIKASKFICDMIAKFAYSVNKKHKKIAFANLDLVYGDSLSFERKNEIVRNSYQNSVYSLYEFIVNQTLDLEGFEKKLKLINEHYIADAIKNGRKIILITAHYGNWEFGNTYIPLKYGPTTMVGRPMNNQYLNDELDDTRTKNNTQMLTKKDASRGLVKALKDGRILGLVIDQHYRNGLEVEFLGQKVKQTDSTSRLAVKFDALIIPMFFVMKEFDKYEAIFCEPIDYKDFENKEDNILALTQAQADVMSKQIYTLPDQWFWQHSRFKKFHNEIYTKLKAIKTRKAR
jgi:Kdo2-lipid IVA lauroyltransferase/acyltransferase